MIALAFALVLAQSASQALTLDEAWAIGDRQNPQAKLARAQSAQAAAIVGQGRSLFYPTLEARASMQWNDEELDTNDLLQPPVPPDPDPLVFQPWWRADWQVVAAQNLSFHGPALPLFRQAKAGRDQAALLEARAKNELAYAIAQAYFGALAAEALAGLAQESKQAADELLRVTRGKADSGRATRTEVLRAELRVREAEQALSSAKRAAVDAQAALGDLLGEPGPFALARPKRPDAPATDADPKRPDVAAAQRFVAGSEEARTAAVRGFYPTVGVQAIYSGYKTSSGTLFGQPEERWAIVGVVQAPIFDGTLRYWQMREKREALLAARAQAEATAAAAGADVRRARRRLDAAREAESLAKERLALAGKINDLVKSQYSLGAATQLELLDADAAQSAARRDAVQSEYETDLSALDVRRSLGMPVGH